MSPSTCSTAQPYPTFTAQERPLISPGGTRSSRPCPPCRPRSQAQNKRSTTRSWPRRRRYVCNVAHPETRWMAETDSPQAMTLVQIEAAIPGLSKKEMNTSINNILRLVCMSWQLLDRVVQLTRCLRNCSPRQRTRTTCSSSMPLLLRMPRG